MSESDEKRFEHEARKASFQATIAFGIIALGMLFALAAISGTKTGMAFALLAAGAAYLAQSAYTENDTLRGEILQFATIALAAISAGASLVS